MFLLQFDACNRDVLKIGSIGFVLYYDNIVLLKNYKLLKQPYNSNYAEYCALIYALDYVIKLNIKDLYVEGDAKIVIDQIKDICSINSDIVKPLYKEVKKCQPNCFLISESESELLFNTPVITLAKSLAASESPPGVKPCNAVTVVLIYSFLA